jgi:hypothetical protein
VAEAVLRFLAPEATSAQRIREERRPAPDPEREDRVMLHRSRLSRIYFARHFFPYPLSITLMVAWRLGLINTTLITQPAVAGTAAAAWAFCFAGWLTTTCGSLGLQMLIT